MVTLRNSDEVDLRSPPQCVPACQGISVINAWYFLMAGNAHGMARAS